MVGTSWSPASGAGGRQSWLGSSGVPVVVVDVPDRDMLTLALVENLQREDLNPIDQAVAFQYLIDAGLTQAQVAERIGKSRSSVANSVRLLQLPEDLRAEVTAGRLGEGHARALLGAPPELRVQLAGDVIARQLTVREIEEAVRAAPGLDSVERHTRA